MFHDRGLVEWKFGGKVAQLSIAAQEYAFDDAVWMLARPSHDQAR